MSDWMRNRKDRKVRRRAETSWNKQCTDELRMEKEGKKEGQEGKMKSGR